jgi:hypothetical protein
VRLGVDVVESALFFKLKVPVVQKQDIAAFVYQLFLTSATSNCFVWLNFQSLTCALGIETCILQYQQLKVLESIFGALDLEEEDASRMERLFKRKFVSTIEDVNFFPEVYKLAECAVKVATEDFLDLEYEEKIVQISQWNMISKIKNKFFWNHIDHTMKIESGVMIEHADIEDIDFVDVTAFQEDIAFSILNFEQFELFSFVSEWDRYTDVKNRVKKRVEQDREVREVRSKKKHPFLFWENLLHQRMKLIQKK